MGRKVNSLSEDQKGVKLMYMYDYETGAKLAKSCPCCGGKHIVTEKPTWIESLGLKAVGIQCKDCGLSVDGHSMEVDFNSAYRDALRKWNRRAAVA